MNTCGYVRINTAINKQVYNGKGALALGKLREASEANVRKKKHRRYNAHTYIHTLGSYGMEDGLRMGSRAE